MRSAKRIFVMLLIVALMATVFAGCGSKDEPEDNPVATSTATPAPTPASEETPTLKPEETPINTVEGHENPATEAPVESSEPHDEDSEENQEDTSDPGVEGSDDNQVDADRVLGSMDGNTYTNDFFGFTITLPEGWIALSREELVQLYSMMAELIDNDMEGIAIDLEKQQVIPLMMVNNPMSGSNIICMAQNMGQLAGLIKDTQSYLNILAQSVKAQGLDVNTNDMETVTIGGQEFGRFSATYSQNGMEVSQNIYFFLKHNFSVLFTLSSLNNEDAQLLMNAMNTLSFN